jgi:hypothetical protein
VIPILLALAAIQSPVAAAPPAEAAENPAAVAAPDAAAEDRYRACTAQVRAEPLRAAETANAWQRAGGGLLARQCLGLAYVALERWEPAATVYEQAARDAAAPVTPAMRISGSRPATPGWPAAMRPVRSRRSTQRWRRRP